MITLRRYSTLTISLCASMTVHALVLCLMAWWYMKHPPSVSLLDMGSPKALAPIIVRTPPPPPPPPPPKPAPQDFSQATRMPLRDDSGETQGKGTANRSTPGDTPMEARQGLEQANLSRNPKPESMDAKMEEATAPQQTAAAAAGNAAAPAKAAERGAGQIASAAPSTGGKQPAGAAVELKGHSTPTSDTDSFAMVAKSNSLRFHDGKMEARQGRRVNTVRPNYGLAAMTDAQSMLDITVVLGVTVDAAGNVTDVTILHSSGSENIDQPTKAAVYNWWFEPKRDKDGHGLPDLWVVRID